MTFETDSKELQAIASAEQACIPESICIYAMGDIHGMSGLAQSLLDKILLQIEADQRHTEIVILGDMIDRGPDSSGVLDIFLRLQNESGDQLRVRLLKGNHEQMMLAFLDNPQRTGAAWLANGGDATLRSYGVQLPQRPSRSQFRFIRDELLAKMPDEHLRCVRDMQPKFTIGDYFFCHARLRKGYSLAEQSEEDLLWSRGDPDDMDFPQEKIIVHGHIPIIEPQMGKYHINVDTGAYVTGRLTAVRLSGSKRDFCSVWLSEARKTPN